MELRKSSGLISFIHNNQRIKEIRKNKALLLIILPVILYFILFYYLPMLGSVIAFQDFIPGEGVKSFLISPWVGFKWFEKFFSSVYFFRVIKNTILLSIYSLVLGFPLPIIFSLLLNELKDNVFKRSVQTISYLPHFISLVVVVGMFVNFLSPADGLVKNIMEIFGLQPINFMNDPAWFRPIYIVTGIWQELGWSAIIYLAALSGIDTQLYEAANMDGAGRFKRIIHVSIPGIMPTIIILFILNCGQLMNVGYEKILLMYNPLTYETADVIQTYVYRSGILGGEFSFSTAVGFFNSSVNFILLFVVNKVVKRLGDISLW